MEGGEGAASRGEKVGVFSVTIDFNTFVRAKEREGGDWNFAIKGKTKVCV
jgi:hypothetical protein